MVGFFIIAGSVAMFIYDYLGIHVDSFWNGFWFGGLRWDL